MAAIRTVSGPQIEADGTPARSGQDRRKDRPRPSPDKAPSAARSPAGPALPRLETGGKPMASKKTRAKQTDVAAPIGRIKAGLGWVRDLPDPRDHMFSAPLTVLKTLPAAIDLKPQFAIYDQGRIGSCTANALAGAIQFDRLKSHQAPDFVPSGSSSISTSGRSKAASPTTRARSFATKSRPCRNSAPVLKRSGPMTTRRRPMKADRSLRTASLRPSRRRLATRTRRNT